MRIQTGKKLTLLILEKQANISAYLAKIEVIENGLMPYFQWIIRSEFFICHEPKKFPS